MRRSPAHPTGCICIYHNRHTHSLADHAAFAHAQAQRGSKSNPSGPNEIEEDKAQEVGWHKEESAAGVVAFEMARDGAAEKE